MTKGTVLVATYQDTLLAKTEKKCEVVDPKKLICAIKFLYCIKTLKLILSYLKLGAMAESAMQVP